MLLINKNNNFMGNIEKWMTKKNMAILGIIGIVGFSILSQRSTGYFLFDSCQNWNLAWSDVCIDAINYFGLLLLLGAIFLIPVLIMFFTKEKIFELWKRTLLNYIYIYIAILIFIPWHGGDAYLRIQKDIIALIASIIYVIFSVFYIFYKNHQLKSE